ncbi:MAG TPA: hypothetical protein VMG09_07305 [Bacteroidota bacterium]|nr:hypothetical protein [Bacteroidota bacterium]
MKTIRPLLIFAPILLAIATQPGSAQINSEMQHERGRLWEDLMNDGWIGSLGAWDFQTPYPLGFFPGFKGYNHPVGNEDEALAQGYENCNFHNFRSGVWIVGQNLLTPGAPPTNTPLPTDYELYASGLQANTRGVEKSTDLLPMTKDSNYCEQPGFDSRLPEEMITATWNTDMGVTVTRRSYVWSYPGCQDFIIYDYTFKNTGIMVSTLSSVVVPGFPQQTLSGLYFVFHSGISVSTKSQLNWSSTLTAIQAGAFGWGGTKDGYPFHDYYHIEGGNTLVYSTNINGGGSPNNADLFPPKNIADVRARFGNELQSPAAFGWLALYASPLTKGGSPRATPKPDVLRVDSHKGGKLQGQSLDLENFVPGKFPNQRFYVFATTPDTQVALGNTGHRFNFYTFSYGPYTMAPGDSLRFVVAEISGVMDYNDVVAGDPNHHFPDSTIAAIRRNADLARNAVKWGIGAVVNGIPIAAQVPPPPPPPPCVAVNASLGLDTPAVAVTWTKVAENTAFPDGAGNPWFDGATDVDGYRIYRSSDFQYSGDGILPAFRGAAWTQIADIPRAAFASIFDNAENKYSWLDKSVKFGLRYGYYVSAYRLQPKTWVSSNGSQVSGLPELASSDVNRSLPVTPAPGPVSSLNVFAAPNPYVYGDPRRTFGSSNPYAIEFRNLPEKATIRIYTLSGDLVRTLQHAPDVAGNVYGSESWDQKTDSGLLVAPGLYIYHVQPDVAGISGTFTGKLMIIR